MLNPSPTLYMRLRDGGYVYTELSGNTVTLCTTGRRRWWQVWKPRTFPIVLAEKEFTPKAGQIVELRQEGGRVRRFVVTVREDTPDAVEQVVLEYA